LILPLAIVMGCSSNGSDPVQSRDLSPESIDFTINPDDKTDNYHAGQWILVFNPENDELKIMQDRSLSQDWDITHLLPYPAFQVVSYNSLTGMLEVDATITNPTSYTGYDLRMVVYTDNLGIRLLNGDDWTASFDIPGGLFINPFKAYAKDTLNRAFDGNGTHHTERLQLYFPGGSVSIKFALTVAWPENCNEPYQIVNFTHGILYDLPTCRTDIQVDVYDWQNDVNSVMLWCPVITGENLVPMANQLANRWWLKLTNKTGASPGDYTAAIVATSTGSGAEVLYDIVQITVTKAYTLNGDSIGFGGISTDTGHGITVDNSGMIYVCGSFNETVDFDPGPGIIERTSTGQTNAYLCKYDPQWNLIWVHGWGSTTRDDAYDVEFDGSSSIIVTGGFCGSVDMDPGFGHDVHRSGSTDIEHIFINKFDLDGNFIWSRTFGGGEALQAGEDVDVDPNGNIYVSGYFQGYADFDAGSGTDMHTSEGGHDSFVVQYGSDGIYHWGKSWGNPTGDDYGPGVDAGSLGNVYLCGFFKGTVDFNPGSGVNSISAYGNSCDAYISKFLTNGSYSWTKTWGGSGDDSCNRCVSNTSGNVYATGGYIYTVDFDPGPGTDESTSIAAQDIYLSKFNTAGDYLWGRRWGGNSIYGGDSSLAIVLDDSENIYVTGSVSGDIDFDPGPGEFIISSMGEDVFISIFDPSGDFIWAHAWGGIGRDSGYGVVNHGPLTYITGCFSSTVDFYPGSGNDIWTSNGEADVFVVRYMH
jgi:hypothetical protein